MRRLPVFPEMRCDEGCGACCGPVPVTLDEITRIKRYMIRNDVVPTKRDDPLTCPLFDGKGCTVHPVRPFICKAFGHVRGMRCPRGYNVNVPDALVDNAIRTNGKAIGLLHTFL
jgi:Fe-S-cluster containining protein